jgi:hypothetical protein
MCVAAAVDIAQRSFKRCRLVDGGPSGSTVTELYRLNRVLCGKRDRAAQSRRRLHRYRLVRDHRDPEQPKRLCDGKAVGLIIASTLGDGLLGLGIIA